MAIVAAVVYALAWYLNRSIPGFVDPLWGRALVGSLIVATFVATYTSKWAVARLPDLLRAVLYCVTIHDYVLLAVNRLHDLQVVGTFLVLAGFLAVSSLMMTRPSHLRSYLAVVVVLSLAVVWWVDEPLFAPAQFLMSVGCFVALAHVAVQAHLQTLERLRAAREDLLADVARRERVEQELRANETRMTVTDRLAAIGTLASGVAHEVNNPLSYVLNNLAFVEERLRALDDGPTITECLGAIDEARDGAQRIRRIVRSLRDYALEGEGATVPTDVNECVRTALKLLDNQIRHRVKLEVQLGEIPAAKADPARIVQVVTNLVTNAVQAIGESRSGPGTVRISTRFEAEHVVVEVEDDGPGFGPDVGSRIFDAFYTTKAQGEGTGLGLYVCQRIVTAVGGTLTATSAPGRGATFRVALVASESPKSIPPPPRPTTGGTRFGVPILVIDDDPLVGRSIARLLHGEDVTLARSGSEGLEACRSRDYGIILCDVMMPEMDGPSVARELRAARPELADRLIFMTGGAFTEHTDSFVAGLPRFLEKPFQIQELERMVATMRG